MNPSPWRSVAGLVIFLAAGSGAWAQREPRIGYVYPAGGQQGTTFQVTLGGQYLDGVTNVHVSGSGIEARVLEHVKPLTQKEVNALREKLRELTQQNAALNRKTARDDPPNPAGPTTNRLPPMTRMALAKEIAALRKKLDQAGRRQNPQLAETVRLEVTLAADAGVGERQLRLGTAAGLSNPLFFWVDRLAERSEKEPNDKTVDSKSRLSPPAILNGQILPGDVDRFRFTARKGAHLVAAARARALMPYLADAVPGWFQGTLTLYDAAGAELAYADDFRFDPDPVLYYEIPEAGEYILEIKDALFRGREDFVYRITLGELPFVTSVFPLGGRVGTEVAVQLAGWNLPVQQLTLDPRAQLADIGQMLAGEAERPVINSVPFAWDALPECLEREPNDRPRTAHPVESTQIINGRIEYPGDWDVFRFEGRAGAEMIAEVIARRLNSPLDSLLELADAEGRELAANDDSEDKAAGLITHQADSHLRVTLPADGTYYLHLGDAQQKGGAAYAYRLRLSPPRPDFELRVAPSTLNARAGVPTPVTVYALRQDGFSGDIHLKLIDPPPGVELSGGWVPAHQDQVRVTLTLPAANAREPLELHLEGRARIAGQEICRPVVPAEDMMQAFIYRHLVPVNDFLAAVTGRGRTQAPLRVLGEQPVKIPAGGTARVQLRAPRRPQVAGEIQLELDEPPPGIAIQEVSATPAGTALLLSADSAQVQPGLKGNLIVSAFTERSVRSPDGKPSANKRRVPLGVLPAIPFEIVAR